MGIMQRVRDGDLSHLNYAAKRKSKSKADDSKSQECTRPDGTKYRIALMRNGKKTVCGGAKVKKTIDTPKGKAAAEGLKKVAKAQKDAGSFPGAIGGLKNGKKYDVTPEMAAVARSMGVSDRQLSSGIVPKSKQADLIKEFDRLSAGGKPTPEAEKGGGLAVRQTALARVQAEKAEADGSKKTPQQRLDQFERIAGDLLASIEVNTKSKEIFSSASARVTAGELRKEAEKNADDADKKYYDFYRNTTPKDVIKKLQDDLKRIQKGNKQAEKSGELPQRLRELEAAFAKKVADAKADPQAAYDKQLAFFEKLATATKNKARDTDFTEKAKAYNAESDLARADAEASIKKASARLQRVWDSLKNGNVAPSAAVTAGMRELGVEPTGDIQADLKAAKTAFRRRAQETHPDLGGDPDAFRAVSESWDKIRTGQIAGGFMPEIDDFTMERLQENGINI